MAKKRPNSSPTPAAASRQGIRAKRKHRRAVRKARVAARIAQQVEWFERVLTEYRLIHFIRPRKPASEAINKRHERLVRNLLTRRAEYKKLTGKRCP